MNRKHKINIQKISKNSRPIKNSQIKQWVETTLNFILEKKGLIKNYEITLRFVDLLEITELNFKYRHKNKATNVLAFPFKLPDYLPTKYCMLGDIAICPEILQKESITLKIPLATHWAHIVIHGVLHLLGYDHIKKQDATIMQDLEIKLLQLFSIKNPYEEN